MKRLSIFVLLFISSQTYAQVNLPTWFTRTFKRHKLGERYNLTSYLKPAFLEADFTGDGVNDIATLVTEKKTHKKGILIIHGINDLWFVFGAGNEFGYGSTDFGSWLKSWRVYQNKVVEKTIFGKDNEIKGSQMVRLKRPGIELLMLEAIDEPGPVAVVYWDERKYIWIHEGD